MFDQGSQLSFVSSVLIKRLQITEKPSTFKLAAVGSDYNKLVKGDIGYFFKS